MDLKTGHFSPKNTEKWGDWAKRGEGRPPYSDGPKSLLQRTLLFLERKIVKIQKFSLLNSWADDMKRSWLEKKKKKDIVRHGRGIPLCVTSYEAFMAELLYRVTWNNLPVPSLTVFWYDKNPISTPSKSTRWSDARSL